MPQPTFAIRKKTEIYSEAFEKKFDRKQVYTKSQLIRVVCETDETLLLLTEENPYLLVVETDGSNKKWLSLQYYDPVDGEIREVESRQEMSLTIEKTGLNLSTQFSTLLQF